MTEQEWLASDDPAAMLRHLTEDRNVGGPDDDMVPLRISDRKLRLFACACHSYGGAVAPDEWEHEAPDSGPYMTMSWGTDTLGWAEHWATDLGGDAPMDARAAILREIAGNPFRPADVDPAWRTPDALALAESAYGERGQECRRCKGCGDIGLLPPGWNSGVRHWAAMQDPTKEPPPTSKPCPDCNGTGTVADGTLDPQRLAVLSDALEEAGCPADIPGETKETTVYVQHYGDGWHVLLGIPSGAKIVERCKGRRQAIRHAEDVYRVKRWTTKKGRVETESPCWGGGLVTTPASPHPLLAHLRSPGPHVRGCWAIDLILGRD